MKRKQTLFEQKLIEKGWHLTAKTYKGKLAKRVEHYIYENEIDNFKFKLFLNAKRELVDSIKMECPYYYVGLHEMVVMNELFERVCNAINRMKESANE